MAPLQVLTFNTWGLWLVSTKRYNRILHLAEFLANDTGQEHKLDVVLLQEVWVDTDARILATAAEQGGLPYAMHFRSGVFGSGLLTLSRYPIVEAAFHQYHCAGDPASITCGDYLAAKGVGWTRLATPSGLVDVFSTHLHANYSHKYASGSHAAYGSCAAATADAQFDIPKPAVDEFAAFRMGQLLELARFVRHVSSSPPAAGLGGGGCGRTGSPVVLGAVLGGDLNCESHTLEAEVLRALLPQLRDCWREAHGSRGDAAADPGHTCNAEGSSYKPGRQRASRIDYVFTTFKVAECELTLKKTPEGHSFSDHIAVRARLELPSPSAAAAAGAAAVADGASAETSSSQPQQQPAGRREALLRAARGVLEEGVQRAGQASAGHVLIAVIMAVQAMLLCVFEPAMSYMGRTMNPVTRLLLPAAVLVLAGGAGLCLLTGLVADGGQARALQQALQQLQVTLTATSRATVMEGGGGGDGAAPGSQKSQKPQKPQKRR